VRLEVQVAADGKVKTVKALGGHPLLVSAAEDAIRRWKFEPGSESKELRTFNFKPVE
jgi:outer membrane biosynthesis protein TonB